ncbi:MAG: RagB/SusD family nutrient uptake outer membrane protein, partial [Bacteroidales bacterium]|nr:RagB/SusD family nutrient uptake outer membrane protein [Bacteroidales bacterium]
MNKIKYIIFAAGLCASTVMQSCVKDLDVEPLTKTTVTSATAWSDEAAADGFVAKIYSAFSIPGNNGPGEGDIVGSDQGEATFTRSYWNLQELTTDEAKCAWSDEALNGLSYCNWGPTNRFIMLCYDRMCIISAYCNEFLNQTQDSKLSVSAERLAEIHSLRAEVRALRAFSYFVLCDLYANVPFTDESNGIGSYMPEQKGRDFLFPWIENELKEVIESGLLPEKSAATYGAVNKYVAEMMLA